MPEAVHTDLVFTISLKRSTQNLQLSTGWPADYPICAGGDWSIQPMPTSGRSAAAGNMRKRESRTLRSGSFRFSLLTRITLKDGEETDLWSARDALVLKALALVLGEHLPVSHRCTHLKGNGGAKYAVREVRDICRATASCCGRT